MARPRRETCKHCERHIDECGPLSSRYLCEQCAYTRVLSNLDDMIGNGGKTSVKWRRGMRDFATDLLAALPDD